MAAAASALTLPALANTVSTNAIQITATRAANSQTGTTQGGIYAFQGTGLTNVTIPTISAAGVVDVANTGGISTTQNLIHNFTGTIRQADTVNGQQVIGVLNTGTFGDMTTKTSGTLTAAANRATIEISNVGAVTIDAGDQAGSSVTGIISTTAAGRFSQVENRRVTSAANTQNITNSDVQQTKYVVAGEGVDALTDGGFNNVTGALGVAVLVTVSQYNDGAADSDGCGAGSLCAAGNLFNIENEVTPSQNSATLNVTSTAANKPGYGIIDHSVGGTTAGNVAIQDINVVTAEAGGAGTTSSLSMIGELTAFH